MSVYQGFISGVSRDRNTYRVSFTHVNETPLTPYVISDFPLPKFFAGNVGDLVACYNPEKPFIYLREDAAYQLKTLFNWYDGTIRKFISEIENYADENEDAFRIISEMAEAYHISESRSQLAIITDLVPGKSARVAHMMLKEWYKKVLQRRLWLLGFTNKDIEESDLGIQELYMTAIRYPFEIDSIKFDRAIELCSIVGRKLTNEELQLGFTTKRVSERLSRRQICLPEVYIKSVEPDYEKFADKMKNFATYKENVFKKRDLDAIKRIAEFVSSALTKPDRDRKYSRPTTLNPTEEQENAIKTSLVKMLSVITGGPGTGKSTTLRGLIELLDLNKCRVLVVSFMGRAVDRCNEVLGDISVDTQTIHSVVYRKGEVVPYDHIVIDEASTTENLLLAKLIKLYPNTPYTFVGDVNQLEPIGKGQAFYDIINCGLVPVTYLTVNKRSANALGIPIFAEGILKWREQGLPIANSQVIFIDGGNEDTIIQYLYHWKQGGIKDHDVMVMCPYVKPCDETNPKLQQVYCDTSVVQSVDFMGYRIGAKLMITKNNNNIGVMNGQTARLVEVYPDRAIIEVKRGIRSGVSKDGEKMERSKNVFERDGSLYEKLEIFRSVDENDPESNQRLLAKNTTLGYMMTGHKGQGGEAKYVFIYIPSWSNPSFVHNSLIYTMVTRAQCAVYIVGSIAKFYECIQSERKIEASYLIDEIKEQYAERRRLSDHLYGVGDQHSSTSGNDIARAILEFGNLDPFGSTRDQN